MKLNTHQKIKDQKGQVIVAVMFLMIIALGVGITISNRYVSSLKIGIGADDATKAVAIAEAAIERVLLLPNSTLEDYIEFNNCGDDCYLSITEGFGRTLEANVQLSYVADSTDPYSLNVTTSDTSQVLLSGYGSNESLYICWNSDASIYAAYIFEDGGEIKTDDYAYNALNSTHTENEFSNATSDQGYESCFVVTTRDNPELLRLKAFYMDAQIYVIPSPGESIPRQGILIESRGHAGEHYKKVSVIKTDPTLPSIFDYVLYQKSDIDALSN
jgi:hypothetical protein